MLGWVITRIAIVIHSYTESPVAVQTEPTAAEGTK